MWFKIANYCLLELGMSGALVILGWQNRRLEQAALGGQGGWHHTGSQAVRNTGGTSVGPPEVP